MDSEYVDAWSMLIPIYIQLGCENEALDALREVLRLKSDSSDGSYFIKLAKHYEDIGKYVEAKDLYEKLVEYKWDYAEAWYNLGVIYKRVGDKKKVEEVLSMLSTIDKSIADDFFDKVVAEG